MTSGSQKKDLRKLKTQVKKQPVLDMIPERDTKIARPVASKTRNQRPLHITEEGKKAQSRLFSYED